MLKLELCESVNPVPNFLIDRKSRISSRENIPNLGRETHDFALFLSTSISTQLYDCLGYSKLQNKFRSLNPQTRKLLKKVILIT